MEEIKLASGDNITTFTEKNNPMKNVISEQNNEKLNDFEEKMKNQDSNDSKSIIIINDINTIDGNEIKLKQRIAQCKDIIGSLKLELNEEKNNLSKESSVTQPEFMDYVSKFPVAYSNEPLKEQSEDVFLSNMYTASVGSKLSCDENLLEYEKQLQRYQNTLNMAQIEKKNAIRKQMLAKAFKLKLLEVENQCNIELLRIKQSLQCLEPLKLIMEKWKTNNNDNIYDVKNIELIPRYPDLGTHSGSDVSSISNADDIDTKIST